MDTVRLASEQSHRHAWQTCSVWGQGDSAGLRGERRQHMWRPLDGCLPGSRAAWLRGPAGVWEGCASAARLSATGELTPCD